MSVVIPNWNGAALLSACLASLRAQTLAPLEVIVVDGASTDDSAALVRARFPEVRLLVLERNLGIQEYALNESKQERDAVTKQMAGLSVDRLAEQRRITDLKYKLDRELANLRIWPAIDLQQSGTRKEEKLLTADELAKVNMLRRFVLDQAPAKRIPTLLEKMEKFPDLASFLGSLQAKR